MKPKSNTLFHFTKNRENLKLILKNGFWPRYCLEDFGWFGSNAHDYVAYPMVCFCDIPLSRISEHVGFYGEFGIGLTRQWAEVNGLNPILYVAGENSISTTFREINTNAHKHKDQDTKEVAKTALRRLLAHTKPAQGRMVIEGKIVEKVFYQESEWRYIPKNANVNSYLTQSKFEIASDLDSANALTKQHCMVKFGPKDVRYIFVKSDADIPDIVNFIQAELDHHPAADQKILMTRVVSLESLSDDL